VDDEATPMLMERFYTHMRAGLGKVESLCQVQLDVRARYPNPFCWAGFVLSRDGGIISKLISVSLLWGVIYCHSLWIYYRWLSVDPPTETIAGSKLSWVGIVQKVIRKDI
jgi:hypothetical protein